MPPPDDTSDAREVESAVRRGAFPIWGWVLCLTLAGVFLWAGGLKAADPSGFLRDIFNHRILPWPLDVLSAVYVPWVEIVAGLALLIPAWRGGGAMVAAGLFLAFAAVTAQAWMRGIDVECGCFGPALRHNNMALSLLINAAGFAAAAAVAIADRRRG